MGQNCNYDRLLFTAVNAIAGTFQKKLADSLQASRSFILPTMEEQVLPTSDFELVTWLVVLAPEPAGTPAGDTR